MQTAYGTHTIQNACLSNLRPKAQCTSSAGRGRRPGCSSCCAYWNIHTSSTHVRSHTSGSFRSLFDGIGMIRSDSTGTEQSAEFTPRRRTFQCNTRENKCASGDDVYGVLLRKCCHFICCAGRFLYGWGMIWEVKLNTNQHIICVRVQL